MKQNHARGALVVLLLVVGGCLLAPWIARFDPQELHLDACNVAPNTLYWFGTDSLGRDLFSMIWYGGRVSLCVGVVATLLSTAIAFLYGTISGLAPDWLDRLLMRLSEFLISIPSILTVIFIQAVIGGSNVWSLGLVIGLTGWMGIAKLIRTSVRQLRGAEFVQASRCMGGGFWHLFVRHFLPNQLPAVRSMVIMNLSSAIATEATLSFLGLGLSIDVISWGSMLSLSQTALLTGAYWVILIPGAFLIATILSLMTLANRSA